MRSVLTHFDPRVAIVPQTQTNADTAIVGAIIDRLGFDSLLFIIALGTLTDADVTGAVTMEHGDASNLSDTAAVDAADIDGTLALAAFTFAADIKCRKVAYCGQKRYVRLTVTPTGNNSGALPISAVALLGHPSVQPTVNPPTA